MSCHYESVFAPHEHADLALTAQQPLQVPQANPLAVSPRDTHVLPQRPTSCSTPPPGSVAPPDTSFTSHLAVAAASTAVVATVLFAFIAGWATHGLQSALTRGHDAANVGALSCAAR